MAPETQFAGNRAGIFSRVLPGLRSGTTSVGSRDAPADRREDSGTVTSLASDAAQLAARLPALVVHAERIAATIAAGQHGRRRAGPGETFWQYRPAQPGEPVTRIDWRQSARSHRAYVRETEAEVAQTVYLWCDLSPSMAWSSQERPGLPQKRDQAILLLLALATLLENGGERVRLLTAEGPATLPSGAGRIAMRLALSLNTLAEQIPTQTLPSAAMLPRYAKLVIAGDFLGPEDELAWFLRHLTARPVPAQMLQIVDPAERDLPYAGRIRFTGTEEGEPAVILPRVEDLRRDYGSIFTERQRRLRTLADAGGHTLLTHFTDQPPAAAMLALSSAVTGQPDGRR
ncbi:DUF58 domain-containing protein [Acetobacter musti]|uniref:DUF58 domain-containing protein n=1 Tax=Acetobacter musti TaxID=864732 RepID=A0ABX0JQI1_9PROT|nr:DUF58 domain-containing protein [Acetobacter musti]NHN85532.1 DUF58 domain-containing protein [Acetobacter musti]